MGANQVEDEGLRLCRGQGGKLCGKGARGGSAPFGDADESAENRRQSADGSQSPEAGTAQGRGERRGASGGEGGVEEIQAALVRERVDAAPAPPRQVCLVQARSHATRSLPNTPRDPRTPPTPYRPP